MARKPMSPRTGPEPRNPSRAAGPPVPESAASSSPPPFYSAGDEPAAAAPPAAESGLASVTFVETVRKTSIPIEPATTADIAVLEHAAAEEDFDASALAAEIERIRKTRKPVGAYAQKLALTVRRGYHRHWFNDTAGRVAEAQANGWAHVLGTDRKPLARCVGTGRDNGAMYAFAMELPEEIWREDMDARNALAADRVEGLKNSPFRAPAGAAKPSDKGKFYDPSDHDAGPLQIVRG